ncbi:MAG TPA: sigma-70 family RNA polymerase sigma factor [Dehalococcoidia bacterium]|nr:sigma-70 family RNA polymerase sigma factor [Dehalococcoidia bacterium]
METYEDEPRLISRSRDGDLEAFNALVERYQRPLYNLCLRMLAAPEAAEDATQEAFINAFRALRTFRGGSFRAWLFRVGANACYDELRRRRGRPAVSLNQPLTVTGQTLDVAGADPTPDELMERAELGELLQRVLSELPADQRLAIVLADVHGLDYSEIAVAMDCSLGTVKSRINRGRQRLRQALRESGELLPGRLRQVGEGQNDAVA